MKLSRVIFLGLLSLPLWGHANYEACKMDLSKRFDVSVGTASGACALDPSFMQTCIIEQSELLMNRDFSALTDQCIDLLAEAHQKDSPRGGVDSDFPRF